MTSSAGQRISCNVVETRRDDVARIFNIQRYSLNDGEGIRTVVFFKGCPHLCPWCANPESISGKIQTVRREAKCLHCAKCLRDADECPSGAFERIGRDISLDALEREVMKDDIFFRTSGGGVTLSGGEVLMQAEFATRFLQRLRLWGVSCAIETAGDAPASKLLPLAKLCDEVLFDGEEPSEKVAFSFSSRVAEVQLMNRVKASLPEEQPVSTEVPAAESSAAPHGTTEPTPSAPPASPDPPRVRVLYADTRLEHLRY